MEVNSEGCVPTGTSSRSLNFKGFFAHSILGITESSSNPPVAKNRGGNKFVIKTPKATISKNHSNNLAIIEDPKDTISEKPRLKLVFKNSKAAIPKKPRLKLIFKNSKATIQEIQGFKITIAQPAERSFILFPKLPLELRLMIFRLLFPPATKLRLMLTERSPVGYFCFPNAPLTLDINQESRRETLKYYQILLERHDRNACQRTIYFNPKTDTISLSLVSGLLDGSHLFKLPQAVRDSVQRAEFTSLGAAGEYFAIPRRAEASTQDSLYYQMRFPPLCFNGLRQVTFDSLESKVREDERERARRRAKRAAEVLGLFEKYKALNPDYSIPKITLNIGEESFNITQ